MSSIFSSKYVQTIFFIEFYLLTEQAQQGFYSFQTQLRIFIMISIKGVCIQSLVSTVSATVSTMGVMFSFFLSF